jgi:DNA-3-methyladenine glycosylase
LTVPAREAVPAAEIRFDQSAVDLAPALIGASLTVEGVGGIVVETEAYERSDPASHSFGGPTARNRSMFGAVGHAYVYRSYGIHWCFNIVCGQGGEAGSAVLVRALQPTHGIETMQSRRPGRVLLDLCRGPGRLCAALAIGPMHDGLPLDRPPFRFEARRMVPDIVVGPRIGITKAADRPWRFGWRGSPYLSRPFRV